MIGDKFCKVSGGTTTTGQVLTGGLITVSEDSIDQLANRDISPGRELSAVVTFPTGLTTAKSAAAGTVVVATDVITAASHGLQTGSPVVVNSLTTVTNVNTGRIFYAYVLSSSTFKLATTLALALAGTPDADFQTADGSITWTSVPELEVQVIAAGNAALTTEIQVLGSSGKIQGRVAQGCIVGTNAITYPTNDPLPEGTPITLAGTLTGTGLTAGVTYFACNTGTSNFALALSRADAMATTPVTVACVVGSSSGVTFTIADSMLATNGPPVLVKTNAVEGLPGRWFGTRYVLTSPVSAGAVYCHINPLRPANPKLYPSGFTV